MTKKELHKINTQLEKNKKYLSLVNDYIVALEATKKIIKVDENLVKKALPYDDNRGHLESYTTIYMDIAIMYDEVTSYKASIDGEINHLIELKEKYESKTIQID